jgi:hypothetical protein
MKRHGLKIIRDLSPRRAQSTQTFKTVSILAEFYDASAFFACSAVNLKDIVIPLENSIVPHFILFIILLYYINIKITIVIFYFISIF